MPAAAWQPTDAPPLLASNYVTEDGGDGVRLQFFEATSASLASATKLASEPTTLPWDRTGLTAGQTRWYWLRSVSSEGNISAFAGPVTASAL